MELDYKTIFKELNDNDIDYLVVGGLAVNLFGVPRLTYDIDLMIHMDPENIEKLVSKLTQWGYKPKIQVNPLEFADEEKRNLWISEKGMKAFNLFSEHLPIGEIDIVIYSPIPYKILKERAVKIQIQDIIIPVISIHDLIETVLSKLDQNRKSSY